MNNQELDKVLDRIQKLLAMAEHERSDPNEAATAAAMAEKLMRKYQVDRAEVIMKNLKAGEDLDTVDVIATAKTNGTRVVRVPPWAQWIAVNVGNFTDTCVRIINKRTENSCIRFYGYSGDTKVASYMMSYLVSVTNRLCNEFKDSEDFAYHSEMTSPRRAMDSYRKGVASGICDALRTQIALKAQEQKASPGTSLVVVKQQAITEKFGEFSYNKNSKSTITSNAYSTGKRDGARVDVTRAGVTHQGNATRRLT